MSNPDDHELDFDHHCGEVRARESVLLTWTVVIAIAVFGIGFLFAIGRDALLLFTLPHPPAL